MRFKAEHSLCPVCSTEAEKFTTPLDENFLEIDHYKHPNADERHIVVMYLESPAKRTSILTAKYASQELLIQALNEDVLNLRARELCPAIGVHEKTNLAMMKDLPFEPIDIGCECGVRPGQPCYIPKECVDARAQKLEHFLIWLAEQRHLQTENLTKKRVINAAEMLGYSTAVDLSYRGHEVIVRPWSTEDPWGLYVGGRTDPTKSVWMTRGPDLTDPERGPFRNEQEIALALRAVGRGE